MPVQRMLLTGVPGVGYLRRAVRYLRRTIGTLELQQARYGGQHRKRPVSAQDRAGQDQGGGQQPSTPGASPRLSASAPAKKWYTSPIRISAMKKGAMVNPRRHPHGASSHVKDSRLATIHTVWKTGHGS